MDFDLRAFESPQQALKMAALQRRAVAISPPEVTGQPPFASFTDRAWYHGGERANGLIATRGNVYLNLYVYVGARDGPVKDALLKIARRIVARIDAVRAGHPLPAALLPLSAEELLVDSEHAWPVQKLLGTLQPAGSLIAVRNGQAVPRAMPASRLAAQDYLVPLAYLAAVLNGEARLAFRDGQVHITLAGKPVVLTKDSSKVMVDGKTVQLAFPVRFRSGRAMVPLSLLETGFGRSLRWQRSGSLLIAQVTPAMRSH